MKKFSLLLLLLLSTGDRLPGHGGNSPSVPEAPITGGLRVPIPGTAGMAEVLSRNPYPLLDTDEAVQLDGIVKLLEAGRQQPTDESFREELAAGQRQSFEAMASQQLLQLLEAQEELILIGGDPESNLPSRDKPLTLQPLRDALLLKLVNGVGKTSFVARPLNLSYSGDPDPVRVSADRGGTTIIYLPLDEIPIGQSDLRLEFVDAQSNTPFRWETISIVTERPGHVSLVVLDEEGQQTPVHLRLERIDGSMLWEPPGAVDLGPIMTEITGLPIYGPGRAVMHYMPGSYRGIYWLTTGAFDGALPPGEWRIVGHKGYEYAPLSQTFSIAPGERQDITIQLDRRIDMPAAGWWSGDDHVHGRLMNSDDATALLTYAMASDIHVANVLEMGNLSRTWYSQRGFGRDFRVQRGDHILVPGQEDPRAAFGHALGLNLKSLARFPDQYMLYDLVADEIHRQGGLYGHTHVGEGGLGIEKDMTLLIPRGKSDFASIMQNVLGTDRYYPFLNLGYRLTASAGSDVPYGGVVGVTRVYVYTGQDRTFDVDEWFAAFRSGRTFVTNGPMIDFRVDEQLPGSVIGIDDESILVEATVKGIEGESAPILVEVIVNGKVHHAQNGDANSSTLSLRHEIIEPHGAWIALRATGANGSQAHTTPVYAHREGFRHWRHADVPQLIEQRRETLAEISALVDAQSEAYANDQIPAMDIWNLPIAKNAEQIRERVSLVSALYDELLVQWEKEMKAGRVGGP